MLSWVDVNFKVLINSEDEWEFENSIMSFVNKLNNNSPGEDILVYNGVEIGGVSSVKFETNHIEDIKLEKIMKKDS